MNNRFKSSWLSSADRHELLKFLDRELTQVMLAYSDFSLHNHVDKDALFKSSVMNGITTGFMFVRYLCTPDKSVKPWIIRKPIKDVLDVNEIKEYTLDVVTWLNRQLPNNNYAALVYTQTIITFLTTMEFKNE